MTSQILGCAGTACDVRLLFTVSQQEESKVLPLVKQENVERDDCNLDLKVEVNIRSECGLSAGECGSRHGSTDVLTDTIYPPPITIMSSEYQLIPVH